ncbi:MAG: alpha-L-rhamnosidase [Phycisphaera sp.]|nr:alpha-L-rhamnosidase [Phycisphaera sp.]
MDLDLVRLKYREALEGLANNTKPVFGFDKPVLHEGGGYAGVWLECAPLEGLVYGQYAGKHDVAKANHEVFFHHQREDGYIRYAVWALRFGQAQIQMVVPIAATALETADLTGDEAFLAKAYDACSRWDDWLVRHRNTRGTGLCEAFCEYDTGHDRSPRFEGLPKECPDGDAATCPKVGKLPYLAPDLSATVYGGRVALSKMAERLGIHSEAERWRQKAQTIRRLIIEHCFDPVDECFYDVDCDGNFLRIRGDVLTRVFSEHVVDQVMFDRIYQRHIKNPASFWTPYPLPSIAVDDPKFDHRLPRNSWGGATQALTALRTSRWFYHYGQAEDHRHLMTQWIEALCRAPDFMQQMNPWTGEFSTAQGYSPAMCVMIEFVERLGLLGEMHKSTAGAGTH